ncbi:lytic transglycosylase domain-containing protein [Diaphorobacter sp. HDW4A]|uniref:lytic transglycosylase domain-containing protein n=1 Tax=Diaphorobacter sp. HDW4A TaxID=2714924 RepID=UPI00140BF7A8|nr:lytic transglycosylase domain-containing protein [Diaphorobacter sp. HDW4A]QIL81898.1 lytic transglycosylase domain-containing protein [Diaphorobacter sp. HDW4A]
MQWLKILTPLLLGASLASTVAPVSAQTRGDDVLLEMQKAFRQKDKQKLSALLSGARGHVLEPWAAYWELKARLEEATQDEVDAFLQRYAGSYQEDRLRNDWLLLLGQRRDWERFMDVHAKFRMRDDKEVQCYALNVDQMVGKATEEGADLILRNWYSQRELDDGCAYAASELFGNKKIKAIDVWRKARLAAEANRLRAVAKAVQIVAPEAAGGLREAIDSPTKYLTGRATARGKMKQEFIVLALIRMAMSDPAQAANILDNKWGVQLSAEERNWLWGLIGKQAANSLSPDALGYFNNVTRDADLNDDMLGWRVRAAMRAGQWKVVSRSIDAMSAAGRTDPTWVYWRGRAYLSNRPGDEDKANAKRLFESIAGTSNFYEQLAREELGQKVAMPPAPQALTAEEIAGARANPGLNRGLYAILLGLRSEGVREWNYATNLHNPGGMSDRELLAAADLACKQEIWDRCVNTSERTKSFIDATQRYPMPFRGLVVDHSKSIGLDPAYVYGLIRQESRFIMDARSHVGASGLMQVMPATAKWTARKIGMTDFTPDMIYDRETNITIGTAYLKLALDDFDGSMALAAAAYNAGPGRPRNWRNGPVVDTAIWAENVPFAETRTYVKNVLANTNNYAAILTGQPQSIKSRLGTVGPRNAAEPEPNKDLP